METEFTEIARPYLRFLPEDRTLHPDDRLRDLGLDSMQAVELLFAMEDGFDIELSDDQLNDETFETAGSLWRVVAEAKA
jgi:acyl carrier protein